MKISLDTACMPWSAVFHTAVCFGALCYVLYQNQFNLASPDTTALIAALISAVLYHGANVLTGCDESPATPAAPPATP